MTCTMRFQKYTLTKFVNIVDLLNKEPHNKENHSVHNSLPTQKFLLSIDYDSLNF